MAKGSSILEILHENYGGPGPMELPASHQAGMKVPKGGSCCANCKWWNYDDSKDTAYCSNKYYEKWAETNLIPAPADEYCSDWWQSK